MRISLAMRVLRISAVSALLALALMVWGVLDPRPIALVVAMSVGQGLGTLSFALYALVVLADLRYSGIFRGFGSRPDTHTPKPPDESAKT
ncbi:MAG TPA: hypothetical protein VJV78_37975 [Polyangiales bacterium]|nr:hypothetical protein [Polyangiales bacterium]